MFSYFVKASVLALVLSAGTCHAEKAWFGKNHYTCPDLSGGLKNACNPDLKQDSNPCNTAAQWIKDNCKSETDPTNSSGVAYFPNMTCAEAATTVFNKIDTNYQNAGYDFMIKNCENK